MKFTETELPGAYLIELERREDQRGYFARTWCEREFAAHGLETRFVQVNLAHNPRRGTLRGLHFQLEPYAEVKVVRCTRGALYDVIVDLRPESPTCGRWIGVELSAANGRALYVPRGFAHGYQTLEDDTDLMYQTSEFYVAEAARGVRYNDPAFGIAWPLPVRVISEADASWPDF